jgi:phosphoserine phosphatase
MRGFDEHRANRLVIEDDRLTGEVETLALGPAAKRDPLNVLRDRFELRAIETLADHAKPSVKAASHALSTMRT